MNLPDNVLPNVESTFLKHSPPHPTNIPFILWTKQIERHGFRNREWWTLERTEAVTTHKGTEVHQNNRYDFLFIEKVLMKVNTMSQIGSELLVIIWEHESVLHPYSVLFKGNVKVPSSSNMSRLLSSCVGLITLATVTISRVHFKKSQKGPFIWARAAARVCRGLGLVNEYYVGGDYSELWLLWLIALCAWQADIYIYPNHSTQHFPASLNSSLSDSEKRCYSNVTTTAQQHLSNSVGLLICYANDCCLMHNQFSVTQMVRWQQTGCYKIALYEWVSHE